MTGLVSSTCRRAKESRRAVSAAGPLDRAAGSVEESLRPPPCAPARSLRSVSSRLLLMACSMLLKSCAMPPVSCPDGFQLVGLAQLVLDPLALRRFGLQLAPCLRQLAGARLDGLPFAGDVELAGEEVGHVARLVRARERSASRFQNSEPSLRRFWISISIGSARRDRAADGGHGIRVDFPGPCRKRQLRAQRLLARVAGQPGRTRRWRTRSGCRTRAGW